MDAIVRLREMGFRVRAEGDKIKVRWTGSGEAPDVTPLLAQLRDRKSEALDALQREGRKPLPWTYTSPDPFVPGWFVARRPGSPLTGRAETELDACLILWAQEEALERQQKEADRDPA